MEGIATMLDYFSPHVYQVSIENTEMVPIRPTSAPTPGNPIEFFYPKSPFSVLDLTQTMLQVRCKLTKANDAAADANAATPVNNFAHSIWQHIDVEFNGKKMTDANNLYAYRAYFEDLLSFPSEVHTTQLQMQGWYKDTSSQMEVIAHDGANKGAVARNALVDASKEVDLWMRPHADPFSMAKGLPQNVDMKVTFIPSKNIFHTKGGAEHKLQIMQATLWVKKVHLTQTFALSLISEQQKRNLHVQLGHSTMKLLSIPAAQSVSVHDQVYSGQLPDKVVFAIIRESAIQGALDQNPFNFQHHGVKYLAATVNGQLVPSRPYEPDFANGKYIRELFGLYQNCNVLFTDKTVPIDRDEFANGYCIWVLDLSQDASCGPGGFSSAPRMGSLSLEVKFAANTANTMNIICYAIYDSFFEIDKYNNIITSFN